MAEGLILFIDTKRPSGKRGHKKIICRVDGEGHLHITTVKTIIHFIQEELRHMDAEEMGEEHKPNTLREFPKQKVWPQKYEGS